MTYARKSLVSLDDTPYYHVVARCVRRAWLCGFDEYAGRDYSYRKHWILERLARMASIFSIDICAYAVMSNHYHLVVHVDRARVVHLSEEEIVERWTQIFSAPPVIERWRDGHASEAEREIAGLIIARWRERLYDLSWFMKCLNEHLARRANTEDNCTGKFWEGRFKSQALLDEAGLLTAMAYVDLNPIRAGVAATAETSHFTSIEQRIREMRASSKAGEGAGLAATVPLKPFRGRADRSDIPYPLEEYLELVDWTGRMIRADERGAIDERLPPIMQRLVIDADAWRLVMRPRGNVFGRAMGRLSHLRLHANTLGQSWVRGLGRARALYAG
jgi:REP element-mobilizing transposase RayT